MSLLNLSPFFLLLGIAALAGILYWLHRLRVRHRDQQVVTTLFWKEAIEETRARVLSVRFRHLLVYLFLLAICSLLWLGLAEPHRSRPGERDHWLLLDASAAMASGTRFDDSVALLEEQLETLPPDARRVVLCASRSVCLLAPGEPGFLLGERLSNWKPEACPSTLEWHVRHIAQTQRDGRPVTITLVGSGVVRPALLDLLPETVEVRRLGRSASASSSGVASRNCGITGLGVAPARSGAWDRVDVLVERQGSIDLAPTLFIRLDGVPLATEVERVPTDDGEQVHLRELPALGQLLEVVQSNAGSAPDDLGFDDVASLRLPLRHRIGVWVSPSLQPVLGPLLAADAGVERISTAERGTADISILEAGAADPPSGLVLRFVADTDQEAAVLLRHESSRDSQEVLLETFDRLGLRADETKALAQATGREIRIVAEPSEAREIRVWNSLVTESLGFVHSRSFPLFVALSVRWLAGVEDYPHTVAVGEPLPGRAAAVQDPQGRTIDPVGASFVPPRAGAFQMGDGEQWVASLADRDSTRVAREAVEGDPVRAGTQSGFSWATTLVLLALGLLALEWFLFRSGRIA